jgi:hypothetical protein
VRELTDHFQRLLGLPDLEQFADEVLVVLERVQKTDELGARVVKLLGRAFGLRLEFLPLVGQELALLRLETVVLRERLELVVDVIERLGAELRDRAIVGHRAEQRGDRILEAVDFGARLLDIGGAVDGAGAVLNGLVQIRHALLKRFELLGEFLDGEAALVVASAARATQAEAISAKANKPTPKKPGRAA